MAVNFTSKELLELWRRIEMCTSKEAFIRTYSGKRFFPLAPRVEDVDIQDIAQGLSNVCRFVGHTREYFSVAQHCCQVSDLLLPLGNEAAFSGLLHDSAEAYLQDIPSPLKKTEVFAEYRIAEARLESVIRIRFGLPPGGWHEKVKEADQIALATEMRDLMPGEDYKNLSVKPVEHRIVPLRPSRAKQEFLRRFERLYRGDK
jgi:uncharacterized protein